MTVLYRARYLLPIHRPPVADGALAVAGGRIAAAGRFREVAAAFPAATVHDYGDAVLLPPLVNAHTHLELSHFPRWAGAAGSEPPASFVDWILQLIRVRRGLTPELWPASLAAGLAASLAAGTGAVGDILTNVDLLGGYRDSPLYRRVFLEVLGREAAAVTARLETLRGACRKLAGPRTTCGLSPHAPYTLSAETLTLALAAAVREGWPVSIHLGEAEEEREFLAAGTGEIPRRLYPAADWNAAEPPPGVSPVAYLHRLGGLTPGCLLAHGVQVDDADYDLLAGSGATVVLCPRSNARLGVGRAPAAAYLARGIPLALGTDSLASAPSLSVWDEIAFAADWFEPALAPSALLAIATAGGAAALGLGAEMGTLEPGKGAHFQVLRPARLPAPGELEAFLCAPGRTAEVDALYLDGRNVLPGR